MSKRERIQREIVNAVRDVCDGEAFRVENLSAELRDFLRPLSVQQVKSVILAACRRGNFDERWLPVLELLLTADIAPPKTGASQVDQLTGEAFAEAQGRLDREIREGLTYLRGGLRESA